MSSTNDSYDIAVIGSGLGGLSAAATLAKSGKKVVVVERHDGPGGNARAFVRGDYTFDPAIHVTGYGYNVPIFRTYLQAIGAQDEVDIVELGDLYAVDIEGETFRHPQGEENVKDYLASVFPDSAQGIRDFITLCGDVTKESQSPPPRVAVKDLDAAVAAFPTLFKYRTHTFQDAVAEFVSDPRAQAMLGAHWPYMGSPPSQLGFLASTASWMALMEPCPVAFRGSFQSLASAMANVVTRQGGTMIYNTRVAKIDVEGGRATGITLEDGRHLKAPAVVSNADATLTFEELVGAEHLKPGYLRRVRRMKPSPSAFVLFSACTLPLHELDLPAEWFIFDHWDHDETWHDIEDGRMGGMWASFPSIHDDSLAPEGQHLVTFTGLLPYDIGESWTDAKPRLIDEAVERIDKLIPGYKDSLVFTEGATPDTFHEYTLTRDGALYGWANTPSQSQPKRMPAETPIDGLFLAGHWTNPGTGCLRCLFSGLRTAGTIAGFEDPISFLSSLFQQPA
jgi:prolycopene isomerase